MADYRDCCIRLLSDDLHQMTTRAIEAETERDAYRDVAVEGIHALHHLTRERDCLRRQLRHLRDEYRRSRQQVAA